MALPIATESTGQTVSRVGSLNLDLELETAKSLHGSTCDELEAVRQACIIMLLSERYRHAVFSWNFGAELEELLGMNAIHAQALAEQRITEALSQDDRITGVSNFVFTDAGRGALAVSCDVSTIFGSFNINTNLGA